MADQLAPVLWRAVNSNGDPVASAEANWFEAGTSTPLTVYQDEALTTPHAAPQVADASGIFDQVFIAAGTAAKVTVTEPSAGSTLYTIDPVPLTSTGGVAASTITFTPITDNAATDVQTAIANENARIDALVAGGIADGSVTIAKIADAAIVTESEGISSNDNDTTLPTSAAVKDYVDTSVVTITSSTYTATLTPATSGTVTLDRNTLSYYRIGDLVHVKGQLRVGSVSSPVGGYNLSLPFDLAPSASGNSGDGGFCAPIFDSSAGGWITGHASAEGNDSTFFIVIPVTLAASDQLLLSFTYETDA